MPTKTNENPTDTSVDKGFLNFCSRHSKKVIITMVILAGAGLAAVGGLWSVLKNYDPNVLAIVGSEKITKADLNKAVYGLNMQGTIDHPAYKPTDQEKQNILNELIDKSIVRQEATKSNITVERSAVLASIKSSDSSYDLRSTSDQQLIFDNTEYNLLLDKVEQAKLGYVDGKYLLVRFDKYASGGFKDDTKYNAEKTQAQTLANDLYQKLQSKQLTFDQAQQADVNDPNLGQATFDKLHLQVLFTGDLNKDAYELGLGPVKMPGFSKIVDGLSAGQISQPTVLQVQGDNNAMVDGVYAIVTIDQKHSGEATNYEDWIKLKESEYLNQNKTVSLVNRVLGVKKAYALAGSGGLVPASSAAPAGFFIRFNYYDAANTRHTDWNAGVTLTHSNDNNASFTWNGVSESCTGRPIVNFAGGGADPGTASFDSAKNFSSPSPSSAGTGWIKLGYSGSSYGGNGSELICSCASTFHAKFNYSPHAGAADDGNWTSVLYYLTNGTTKSYNLTSNNFDFSAIANGYTSGLYVNYQANRPPVAENYKPTDGTVYTNSVVGGTSKIQFAGTYKSDPDPNDSAHLSIMYKKDTDSYWTSFGTTTRKAPDGTTSHSNGVVSSGVVGTDGFSPMITPGYNAYMPSVQLPKGTYTFRTQAQDAAGAYSTAWSDPWTVTVNDPTTITPPPSGQPTLSCTATPATGEAPLAVKVEFTSDDGAGHALSGVTVYADINGQDANSYANILSPVIFTYKKENSYSPGVSQATIKNADGTLKKIPCQNVPITVTNPSNPNGGEVPAH